MLSGDVARRPVERAGVEACGGAGGDEEVSPFGRSPEPDAGGGGVDAPVGEGLCPMVMLAKPLPIACVGRTFVGVVDDVVVLGVPGLSTAGGEGALAGASAAAVFERRVMGSSCSG